MFRDVPTAAIETPRGRRSADDAVDERERLRSLLADRDVRQRVLKALDGRASTGNVPEPRRDRPDFSRVTSLPQEAVQAFGVEAGQRLRREFGPEAPTRRLEGEDRLVDEILRKRTLEFAWKKDLRAARLRELNEERGRLLAARERVQERRDVEAVRPLSPPYGEAGLRALPESLYREWNHQRLRPTPAIAPSRAPAPEPVSDIVADTRLQLPRQVERYRELRQQFEKNREAKTRPYNGELGVESYEPWQVKHFHTCRSIVDEEVCRFLDSVFPAVPAALTEKTSQALRSDERRRLERQWVAVARNKTAQLIAEGLLLEVTSEQSRAAVREYHFLNRLAKNMADQMCMRQAEIMATSRPFGRDETDPAYRMVTDAFYASQRDRNRARRRLWLHRQHMHTAVAPTAQEAAAEKEDDDLRLIEFEHLPPVAKKRWTPLATDMSWDVRRLQAVVHHRDTEMNYWRAFAVAVNSMGVPKNTKGISSVSLSPNDRFLGVGTVHGDLLIYDLRLIVSGRALDLRCLRVLYNVNVDDPLISVGWSRDSNQLLTVNRLGLLNLWSFSAGAVSREDASKLGVAPDKTTGVFPTQLTLILQFDTDAFDFRFSAGPLAAQAEVGDSSWMPNFAVFFPTFTVFASQYAVVAGMSSHDLLLIDSEPLAREFGKAVSDAPPAAGRPKKGRTEELTKLSQPRAGLKEEPDNRVGNEELRADMFRGHKHPVIHMGFIGGVGDMFSVDQQGYIFVWRYDDGSQSEYHWFRRFRKFRLNMQITSFTPSPNAKPLVRFDEASPDLKTKDAVARSRAKTEEELARIGFRHPWLEIASQGKNTAVYRPLAERATESGAMFHEVTRRADGQLALYQTRVYKSHVVFADFFLGCTTNADSTELVCMLLVPRTSPFPPRVELLIVHLPSMSAREPRVQIDLSDPEYDAVRAQGAIYFGVGRAANATGAEYAFVNLLGNISVYSLSTGQQVGVPVDPKPKTKQATVDGLQINKLLTKMRPELEIVVASIESRYILLCYKKGEVGLRLLRFDDLNDARSKQETSESFTALEDKIVYARDFRLDGDNLFFHPDTHPVAGVREVLYRAMDTAVHSKLGAFPLEKRKTHDQLNRVNGFAAVERLAPPSRSKPTFEQSDNPLIGDVALR